MDPRYVAIYSRKSRFTGVGESTENQVELCRAFLRAHAASADAEAARVFEDEGFSGSTTNRPRFQAMMRELRAGRIRTIVVYRLDRISRNIGDFAKLMEELNRLDVAFLSVREQFDTASPMGRAMLYIASVFSQLERETIAERIRDNLQELAKTGRWLGGVTPLGFRSERNSVRDAEGRKRSACHLMVVPDEAALVQTIFHLALETRSLSAVAGLLRDQGAKTRQGKDFTVPALRSILSNPVYCRADEAALAWMRSTGVLLFVSENRTNDKSGFLSYRRTDQSARTSTLRRSPAEWIVSVGQHPGLVTGEIWVAAQRLLAEGRSRAASATPPALPWPRDREALLTGLLFCACGSRMRTKRENRPERAGPPFVYRCPNRGRHPGQGPSRSDADAPACKIPDAAGPLLDRQILTACGLPAPGSDPDPTRRALRACIDRVIWDGRAPTIRFREDPAFPHITEL